MEKVYNIINSEKKCHRRLKALLINIFIWPGLGEMSLGRYMEGLFILGLYGLWSIIAIISITSSLPIGGFILLDLVFRFCFGIQACFKEPQIFYSRNFHTHKHIDCIDV